MVDYVFPQDYITHKGSSGKYPVKTCCMSDDLSGDMLAPSWPNIVFWHPKQKPFSDSWLFCIVIMICFQDLFLCCCQWVSSRVYHTKSFQMALTTLTLMVTFGCGVRIPHFMWMKNCIHWKKEIWSKMARNNPYKDWILLACIRSLHFRIQLEMWPSRLTLEHIELFLEH